MTRLTTMLIQFEMVRMENRQLIERERQRIYANNTNIFLKQEVDDAIAERQDFPVEQMYRLIEFFEGRHSRTVELLVALCAAIVGGVVGAIGTAYFSGS